MGDSSTLNDGTRREASHMLTVGRAEQDAGGPCEPCEGGSSLLPEPQGWALPPALGESNTRTGSDDRMSLISRPKFKGGVVLPALGDHSSTAQPSPSCPRV